jgi:hypothetical protein
LSIAETFSRKKGGEFVDIVEIGIDGDLYSRNPANLLARPSLAHTQGYRIPSKSFATRFPRQGASRQHGVQAYSRNLPARLAESTDPTH